ncbi:VPA1262 family N-terminal domain-containing protein [Psychrobacter fozii]|uniref:VPA1262 family N-terminal domain-containing protein n=1 Tax=Psychrobacter fozii TaxID=198480 RepID=UPI00191928E8|nr:VPA1262 family N-terminal domain-containing protein [Psychrobacter fozii]
MSENNKNLEVLGLYEKAEIRLVTKFIEDKNRLIFATVTLLPKDAHTTYSTEVVEGPNKVYFRKVVLPASEAIEWYRIDLDNGENKFYTPTAEEQFCKEGKVQKYKLDAISLIDETIWGDFGIPLTNQSILNNVRDNPAPFLGYNSARIHRRFGAQADLLNVTDKSKVIDFIKQGLFIDLKEYPEYIGGIVLVLPNPIIQSVENRLVHKEIDGQEQELRLLKLNLYPSQSLEGLKLINFEVHLDVLKNWQEFELTDGIVTLPNTNPYQSHGYFITHETYGCLEFRPATSFVRQMRFNSQIIESNINVKTNENSKKTSPFYEYNTSISTPAQETLIGQVTPDEVYHRVIEARNNRNSQKEREQSSQFWFNEGHRKEALDKLGELIRNAKKDVEFYDPYFGALQITQYALKAQVSGLKINIITSRLAFSSTEESKIMQHEIEAINNKNMDFKVNCFVLDQDKPTLHDRFLVIDDTIWFIGHSFNRIGEKNAFMTQVPYTTEVFIKLQEIKNSRECIDIAEYSHITKPDNRTKDPKSKESIKKQLLKEKILSFIRCVKK